MHQIKQDTSRIVLMRSRKGSTIGICTARPLFSKRSDKSVEKARERADKSLKEAFSATWPVVLSWWQ